MCQQLRSNSFCFVKAVGGNYPAVQLNLCLVNTDFCSWIWGNGNRKWCGVFSLSVRIFYNIYSAHLLLLCTLFLLLFITSLTLTTNLQLHLCFVIWSLVCFCVPAQCYLWMANTRAKAAMAFSPPERLSIDMKRFPGATQL